MSARKNAPEVGLDNLPTNEAPHHLLWVAPAKVLGDGAITRHPMVITDEYVDPTGDIGAGILTKLCPPPPEDGSSRRGPKVKLAQYQEVLEASAQLGREEGKDFSPPTLQARLIRRLERRYTAAKLAFSSAVFKRRVNLLLMAAREWRLPLPPKTATKPPKTK
jgi:hypothetical protein